MVVRHFIGLRNIHREIKTIHYTISLNNRSEPIMIRKTTLYGFDGSRRDHFVEKKYFRKLL